MKNINLSEQQILDRIGYFMNLSKITAYKLSTELGHSKNYFYRFQSGEMHLSLDTFLDILDILKVTTTDFFLPSLKDDDKILIDMISGLSSESKQTILDLIKKLK